MITLPNQVETILHEEFKDGLCIKELIIINTIDENGICSTNFEVWKELENENVLSSFTNYLAAFKEYNK